MTSTRPLIVGFSGYKRSGKDTAALELAAALKRNGFSVVLDSFAAPIRQFAIEHLDMTETNKEEVIPWLADYAVTPRLFMQLFGTELGRDMIHPDLWVRMLERRVQKLSTSAAAQEGKLAIIVTDVRFINEIRMLKNLGAHLIRVERPGTEPVPPKYESKLRTWWARLWWQPHLSESTLDMSEFDLRLENNSTLDVFKFRCASIVDLLELKHALCEQNAQKQA